MRKTAAYAFHHSIPILIGFFPVGIAYGLLMQQACSSRPKRPTSRTFPCPLA